MTKWLGRLLLVMAIGWANAGCASQQQPQVMAAASAEGTLEKELHVSLASEKAMILQENKLTIVLSGEMLHTFAEATVTVSLSMPQMDHGELVVQAASVGDGQYEARIVPTMIGKWDATITIEKDGHVKTIAFPFEAVR